MDTFSHRRAENDAPWSGNSGFTRNHCLHSAWRFVRACFFEGSTVREFSSEILTYGSTHMIDKSTAEHYRWGQNCEGWHLVKSESMSVIQELMPPHTSEVRHKHVRSRQFFFVLSGQATIECDGKRHVLETQQGIAVGPDVAHQVLNQSDTNLHFLVISSPPSHGDRITI